LIPAVFDRANSDSLANLTDGADPKNYLWSEMVARISAEFPAIKFVICCYEDLPFIWGQLAREMLDIPPGTKIRGAFDLISDIMQKPGMKRFRKYLKSHPDYSELQKRRVISTFLEKYARSDKIFESISVPGWNEDLMTDLSEIYEDDTLRISRLPNVNLITL
jgi:hypothetical protein